jgi:hypothetical protein
MENLIKDISLIILGGASVGLISVWIDIKRDREKMRWEQWYRNRNKR